MWNWNLCHSRDEGDWIELWDVPSRWAFLNDFGSLWGQWLMMIPLVGHHFYRLWSWWLDFTDAERRGKLVIRIPLEKDQLRQINPESMWLPENDDEAP